MTLHGFRHSHTSLLINKGLDIASVSNRLGHSNSNITLQIYTHLYKENKYIR
ncbi:tyrosine-type recombinase/integrase [Streptobacillus felis]|uniref:Tyrosine-type recombinase/integrase n=1 Tax=Streptobacillus felis TaxID=1384509 RepID=A0A7Z0PFS4_9FUSO|nr:tyrosine-type recombinase/integrase [Streptobacillus felis]